MSNPKFLLLVEKSNTNRERQQKKILAKEQISERGIIERKSDNYRMD